MDKERKNVLDWVSERLNLTEIFSLLTSYGLFYAELDSRKPFREAYEEARQQALPSYGRWPRVLGLVVVVLLSVEILTGVLLSLYYLPTPQTAHASLGTILRDVDFGWFVHQIHFWGARFLIAVLILRIVRFSLAGVWRSPRELVWVFGVLLLMVCLHADLTGRLLPWTTDAYWSSVRSLEVIQTVPMWSALTRIAIGGDGTLLSDLTLLRFYVMHVAVLPLVALGLIYLHFSTVRRVGLREVRGETRYRGEGVFRHHLIDLAILLTVLFALLVTFAVLLPKAYLGEADAFSTSPGVGPPWYLLAPFGFLEWTSGVLPTPVAGLLVLVASLGVLGWPFLARSRGGERSPVFTALLALAVLAAWIALTVYGARVV